MANFNSADLHRGLVFKFQGRLYKIVDFPTKTTVSGKNVDPKGLPVDIKVPHDRLKKPTQDELSSLTK